MKFSFGFKPFSALRKRLTGRVRSLKIRSYVLILLSALLPLSLIFIYSYSIVSNLVVDNTSMLAETLRDARSERIRLAIVNLYGNVVSSAASTLESGTLTGYNSADTVKSLTEFLEDNAEIERMTIFDSFYEPLAAVDDDGVIAQSMVFEQIRVKLMDIRFEDDISIFELDLDDAHSRLVIFGRITAGNRVRGYVTAMFDYDHMTRLIGTPVGMISIYNGRYQRIADSFGLSNLEKNINPLTERMLDGYTETVRLDSEIHSYGFIDLITTELFLDVAIPLHIGSAELNSLVVAFIFFLFGTAFIAAVIAWTHVRSIVSYGESILLHTRFSKEMRLFSRFSETLESIQSDMQVYADMQTNISNLKRDVLLILSELPREESEDEE